MRHRVLISVDLRSALQIERDCFEYPWDEKTFKFALKRKNLVAYSLIHEEQVIGYVFFLLRKSSLHIINIAVAPEFQRSGGGRYLINTLMEKLNEKRVKLIVEVRETNLPAQLFFKSLGFKAVSVLRNSYEETTEDAYKFQFLLPKVTHV